MNRTKPKINKAVRHKLVTDLERIFIDFLSGEIKGSYAIMRLHRLAKDAKKAEAEERAE